MRTLIENTEPNLQHNRPSCRRPRNFLRQFHGRNLSRVFPFRRSHGRTGSRRARSRRIRWIAGNRSERARHFGWQLIGSREQCGHIPELLLGKRLMKSRHARQPDSVLHLPVGHARRIVCHHTVRRKQLRRRGKHPCSGRRFCAVRQSVAERAIRLIHFRAGRQIGRRECRNVALRCFLVNSRVEGLLREIRLHRHRLVCRRHRGKP